MQHAYKGVSAARLSNKLHLPHALPAIPPVLLQHPRAGLQPLRERPTKFGRATIKMRVRAPAEMLGAVQDLLDTHFENDVGMRADPRSARDATSGVPSSHDKAGRDGFWLARWLEARGVEAHVIHPSSSRRLFLVSQFGGVTVAKCGGAANREATLLPITWSSQTKAANYAGRDQTPPE